MEGSNHRLFKGSVEKKSETLEALKKKYTKEQHSTRLTKEKMQSSALRLWKESQEHAIETHKKLFDEYCPALVAEKLPKAKIAACVDRLAKK
jgi:hypothetical protein